MMRRPTAVAEPALLAFIGGAALALAAAWQWGGVKWLLGLAAPLWLAPLAVYDLRHRQVPHLAWVAGPCLLAIGWATTRGDWALAALALLVPAASERSHLPAVWRRPALAAGLVPTAWLVIQAGGSVLTGALAILAFWLMFELGWWAGADALAAITLALLWPDIALLAALAAGHLGWALVCRPRLRLPRPQTPPELDLVGQPGFPALALAAGLRAAMIFTV